MDIRSDALGKEPQVDEDLSRASSSSFDFDCEISNLVASIHIPLTCLLAPHFLFKPLL